MKTRRRCGAGAAGVAVVLLAAPITSKALADQPAHGRGDDDVAAASQTAPVVLTAASLAAPIVITTTTTAPPPPPPPPTQFCPVGGATEFVDSWGNARSGGRRHEGVDMLAAYGTPVLAPVAGMVEHRGSSVGGMSYHLTAADGTYYYGTHLSGYAAGGWVAAGTVIGYVGDSGNARGASHLHFEIHPGGQTSPAMNPFPTALDWCTPG
jgi:murein DD-endopeptidase MepM/ murein hydrolase activator NlpD